MELTNLADTIETVADALNTGQLVVLRTDTLYGIIAKADIEPAVHTLQKVRKREPGKAFIVLVADPQDAYGSDIDKVSAVYEMYSQNRPTSVVVDASDAPDYLLHRDGSLAYRVPRGDVLQALLRMTGPLVAPSANIAGAAPSQSISEAKQYFGDQVAVYVDDGDTPPDQQPSSVIKVTSVGEIIQIR